MMTTLVTSAICNDDYDDGEEEDENEELSWMTVHAKYTSKRWKS
jgi:hypothetical protein